MKTRLEGMKVTETKIVKKRKDNEEKITYSVKLDSGDGITAVLKSQTEFELREGENGLTLTIDNPQTRLSDTIAEGQKLANDYVEASKKLADAKRKPDVMVEDKKAKRPKGSDAIDGLGKPTPEEVGKSIQDELDRKSAEADEKIRKQKGKKSQEGSRAE